MPAALPKKPTVKAAASRLVNELPDSASWEDLMYQIFVRQKIENGLADLKAGRKHDHSTIRKELGLTP